jgi:Tfp pilus assembly protein PilF
MSLLMKALEKAAKDRGDAGAEPAMPANPSPNAGAKVNSELTLEPIILEPDEPVIQRAPPPREKSASPSISRTTARDSAKAATIVRAGARADRDVFAYMRERPLVMLGGIAALFMVGFGGYVYLQMNPGMFASQPPRPAPIAQAPVPAPAPAPTAPAGSSPSTQNATAPATPVPLTSLLPPTELIANKDKPAATSSVAAAAVTPAVPAAPAAPAVAAPSTPRETIKITTGTTAPTVNPVLSEAYHALAAGNLEASQKLYSQLLKSDARNVDALLGLAAIATQQGDRDTSAKNYVRVIELDPRNSLAQAGLIGMVGSADPQSAETRVKQLIARDPSSGYLYFTLGNTYVDQQRWPDAQQAFFQAHHLQPDNPDYAYNLAIALEHIGQPKSALDFYRRAVLLAAAKGHANFNSAAAQERVNKLEKVVQ